MYYLLVVFSVFAAACAQMLLKKGANLPSPSGEGLGVRLVCQYLNPWVIGGYVIMGLTMVLNVYCMSKGVKVKEVSIIESMSYLFVPLLSFFLFREKMTGRKCGAVVVIIIGIIVFFV